MRSQNRIRTHFVSPSGALFFARTQGRRNTAPRSGALEKSRPCLRARTHGCLLSEVGGRLGPGGIYREFCVRHNGTLAPACPSHHSNPSKNLPKKLIQHHHAYPLPTSRRRPGQVRLRTRKSKFSFIAQHHCAITESFLKNRNFRLLHSIIDSAINESFQKIEIFAYCTVSPCTLRKSP